MFFSSGRRSFNDCASSPPCQGSAVRVVSWYSIQLLVEKLRGAGPGREGVLVWLLLPLAASITFSLSTRVLYFQKKGFETSLVFVFEA